MKEKKGKYELADEAEAPRYCDSFIKSAMMLGWGSSSYGQGVAP